MTFFSIVSFLIIITGDDGYISDTEDSKQIQIDLENESRKALIGKDETILHMVQHDSSEL